MRLRGPDNGIGARFGRGRPWSERTTLQRISVILDFAVVAFLVALVLYVIWLLFFYSR